MMKQAVFFLLMIFATSCSAQSVENKQISPQPAPPLETPAKQTVLIELYTSEG